MALTVLLPLLQPMEGEGVEQLESRKQAAGSAHRRLRIAQSDALDALSAFVSWLGAEDKEHFCRCALASCQNLCRSRLIKPGGVAHRI